MNKNHILLPDESYALGLKIIGGVKYTKREADIVSCIICGRTSKKIASFLSLSPKTVENYLGNLMKKLEIHSREELINFIEKSEKTDLLRDHYKYLTARYEYEKVLHSISFLIKTQNPDFHLISFLDQEEKKHSLIQLQDDLKLAGVQNTCLEISTDHSSLKPTNPESEKKKIVYFLSDKNLTSSTLNLMSQNNHRHIFFVLFTGDGTKLNLEILQNPQNLIIKNEASYYSLVLELLKKTLDDASITSLLSEFVQNFKPPNTSTRPIKPSQQELSHKTQNHKNHSKALTSLLYKKSLLASLSIIFIGFGLSFFFLSLHNDTPPLHKSQGVVRHDLAIPSDSVFLERPQIIHEIETRLKEQKNGIRSIALVGPGGAGKTTLAHQYGLTQRHSICWKLHCETSDSLKKSFESLAEALSILTSQQETLKAISENKNPLKRDEGIINFVKENLRDYHNWFLIYDNVENFSDIQSHYPQDINTWGSGIILLTARDTNIKNNIQIKKTILIGELTPQEKTDLFLRVMNPEALIPLNPNETKDIHNFLENIPPFPLDVVVASNYIKATGTSYEGYLNGIKKNNDEFTDNQRNIIKETGSGYTKTRYGIITMALQRLLETNKDFKDLLLLISLIDSENIPRDLLVNFKNEYTVDNFIYHLQKHSLISINSKPSQEWTAMLSMHRSTQAIALTYLKEKLKLESNLDYLTHIIDFMNNYAQENFEITNVLNVRSLIPHYVKLLTHEEILSEQLKAKASAKLGFLYVQAAEYVKGKSVLEKTLSEMSKRKDENLNKIYEVNFYLGKAYWGVGDFNQAIKLFESMAYRYKEAGNIGPEYPRVLVALVHFYRVIGQYKKASLSLKEGFPLLNKYYENDANNYSWMLATIGFYYVEIGDYKKAKEILEKSIYFTKNSPINTAALCRLNGFLGALYMKLGDYQQARDYIEQANQLHKKAYPKMHFSNIWTRGMLANIHSDLGALEKAEILLQASYNDHKEHYGAQHFETAKIIQNLGQLYLRKGDYNQAESSMQTALQIFENHNHPQAYISLEELSELYLQRSRDAEKEGKTAAAQELKDQAYSYLLKAQKVIHDGFPPDSPHIQRIDDKVRKFQKS